MNIRKKRTEGIQKYARSIPEICNKYAKSMKSHFWHTIALLFLFIGSPKGRWRPEAGRARGPGGPHIGSQARLRVPRTLCGPKAWTKNMTKYAKSVNSYLCHIFKIFLEYVPYFCTRVTYFRHIFCVLFVHSPAYFWHSFGIPLAFFLSYYCLIYFDF